MTGEITSDVRGRRSVIVSRSFDQREEIEMTPMVDVTFLLLIFFMVTASFNLHKSIAIPRRSSELPSRNQRIDPPKEIDRIEVQINRLGGFFVIGKDWEREVVGKQALVTTLKDSLATLETRQVRLIVKVDEDAVLSALVDAIDAGKTVGFLELQIAELAD